MTDATTAVADPGVPGWLAIAMPAVAMSLGWGLAGQYGGGEGAMIVGALGALALTTVARTRISATTVWIAAMAGALGFGIGGEMTYGQTIGLTAHASTAAWGYLGLLLKGAVWGGVGGLFIGAALGGRRYTTQQLFVAFNLALIVACACYWAIDESRLIYFSGGGSGPPRQECWAALWGFDLVLITLAAYMRDRVAVRLSLGGTLGCGIGFALGWVIFRVGQDHLGAATSSFFDWWKVAECTTGLLGGLALGWAWLGCDQSRAEQQWRAADLRLPATWTFVLLSLDLLLFFRIADGMEALGGLVGAAPFVFLAPAAALLAWRHPGLALVIGAAMPVVLTLSNVQYEWAVDPHLMSVGWSTLGLVLLSAFATWYVVLIAQRGGSILLYIAWICTACAWAKYSYPAPAHWGVTIMVQGVFMLMAGLLTIAICRGTGAHLHAAIGDWSRRVPTAR